MRIALAPIRRSRIPLTSLVDVIFILLFFFMLAAHDVDWRALRVDLAKPADASAPKDATRGEALKIVMLSDGELHMLGRRASRIEVLDEISNGPRDRAVVLVPGRGVDVQAMVSLLDAITPTGVNVLLGSAGNAPS
jgi:biopolymer transport protein ExbD